MAYETLERATIPEQEIPSILRIHSREIASSLRASSASQTSLTGKMIAYHMGWTDRHGERTELQPGKLVRPALCLWSCEACGGDARTAMPAATALEWVHNFTLVHDDIQDGDRERRGRDTVWAIWGLAQGINAGDALFALAFSTLTRGHDFADRRLRAARLIADAVLVVVEGQSLDLRFEGRPDTPLRSYVRMIRSKTGALIGAALEAGAVMAGANAAQAHQLRYAGNLLGIAFQMRDDWLGTWGDSATTGKSASGDLRRAKLTYPIVAGYAAMKEPERRRLLELFTNVDPRTSANPLLEIRSLLESVGGSRLTMDAPRHFAERAVAAAAASGLSQQRVDQLHEVALYVAHRTR